MREHLDKAKVQEAVLKAGASLQPAAALYRLNQRIEAGEFDAPAPATTEREVWLIECEKGGRTGYLEPSDDDGYRGARLAFLDEDDAKAAAHELDLHHVQCRPVRVGPSPDPTDHIADASKMVPSTAEYRAAVGRVLREYDDDPNAVNTSTDHAIEHLRRIHNTLPAADDRTPRCFDCGRPMCPLDLRVTPPRYAWHCPECVAPSKDEFADLKAERLGFERCDEPPVRGRQIGGDHYAKHAIQPWDAMEAWFSPEMFVGFLTGNALKYLARFRDKGGLEDVRKAGHYVEKLVEVLSDAAPTVSPSSAPPPGRTASSRGAWPAPSGSSGPSRGGSTRR